MDPNQPVIVASSPGDAPTAKRRLPKHLAAQLPRTLTVTMQQHGVESWEATLLAERARKNPAMEASAENFASLLEWVEADFNDDLVRRPQHGALVAPSARRSPRGPKHAREYYVNGKWVTKIPEAEPAPYSRRFRTLKRRVRDQEVDPRTGMGEPPGGLRAALRGSRSMIAG